MFPYKTYAIVTFYLALYEKWLKNIDFKEPGALLWHAEVSRFPYSLINLSCMLSNNTCLTRDFMCLLFEGAQTGI